MVKFNILPTTFLALNRERSFLATDNMPSLTSTPVTEPEGPTDRAAAKVTSPVPHARSNICHPVCGFRNETKRFANEGARNRCIYSRENYRYAERPWIETPFNCHKLTQTWLQYSKSVIRTSKTLSSAYILLLRSAKALLYLERQIFLYCGFRVLFRANMLRGYPILTRNVPISKFFLVNR